MVSDDRHTGGRDDSSADIAVSVDIVNGGRRGFGRISEEAGRPFVAVRDIVGYAIAPANGCLPRTCRVESKPDTRSKSAAIRDLAAEADSSCSTRYKAVPGREIVMARARNQVPAAIKLSFGSWSKLAGHKSRIQGMRRDIVIGVW